MRLTEENRGQKVSIVDLRHSLAVKQSSCERRGKNAMPNNLNCSQIWSENDLLVRTNL